MLIDTVATNSAGYACCMGFIIAAPTVYILNKMWPDMGKFKRALIAGLVAGLILLFIRSLSIVVISGTGMSIDGMIPLAMQDATTTTVGGVIVAYFISSEPKKIENMDNTKQIELAENIKK